ncbi:type IX secretion system membrane protein PorP/SprF [Bacteroidales bacterium]|nr:type IX secretion system membrane protein PorP/SprF [Bacteroidales bacterium]
MKKYLLYILLLALNLKLLGINPQFSQFYSNPLYLAPSFAGAIHGSRMSLNYREQWLSFDTDLNTYRTYNVAFDHYFNHFNSGVGISLLKDVAGSGNLGITKLSAMYSYNLKIFNVWHVRPGLSASYLSYGVDFQKLNFMSDIKGNDASVVLPPIEDKLHKFDATGSMLIYSKHIWIGGTVDHLVKPTNSFFDQKNKAFSSTYHYKAFGGVTLIKESKLLNPIDETITFAFQYQKQLEEEQLDAGVYWYKFPLVLGAWYRGVPLKDYDDNRGDAIIFLIGFKNRQFNVGYSYDFTISNLIGKQHGSHEISIVYKFNLPERKEKRGMVPCPEF